MINLLKSDFKILLLIVFIYVIGRFKIDIKTLGKLILPTIFVLMLSKRVSGVSKLNYKEKNKVLISSIILMYTITLVGD